MSHGQYLRELLRPLGVYDLEAPFNGGALEVKGAALDRAEEELEEARGAIRRLGGEVVALRRFRLPGGDERGIIVIKKISQTPTAYPRNGGKIAKSPLK